MKSVSILHSLSLKYQYIRSAAPLLALDSARSDHVEPLMDFFQADEDIVVVDSPPSPAIGDVAADGSKHGGTTPKGE